MSETATRPSGGAQADLGPSRGKRCRRSARRPARGSPQPVSLPACRAAADAAGVLQVQGKVGEAFLEVRDASRRLAE